MTKYSYELKVKMKNKSPLMDYRNPRIAINRYRYVAFLPEGMLVVKLKLINGEKE